jgi:hypothetical protein
MSIINDLLRGNLDCQGCVPVLLLIALQVQSFCERNGVVYVDTRKHAASSPEARAVYNDKMKQFATSKYVKQGVTEGNL